MKRLRRWAIPVLLAFLMFSCAGCGDSAPVTEDEGGTPPSGSVSAESTPVYSFPSEKEEQSAGYKLGRIYETMEELFEAADSIIIGEVCYRNSISMRNSGARMLRYGWRRRYTGTSSPRKCSPCVRWGPNSATGRRGPYYKSLCSGKGSGCCFSSLKMRGSSLRGITAAPLSGNIRGSFSIIRRRMRGITPGRWGPMPMSRRACAIPYRMQICAV